MQSRKMPTPVVPNADIKRVAIYARVSTDRQAEGDVSLPSQIKLGQAYCIQQGWLVVKEFIEPGASGTDENRPILQQMIDLACSASQPFDVILVHAFSRFYRDAAVMEMTIRKLEKRGVGVVSITQPSGPEPAQQMTRQLIGIFDEYHSKENAKNTRRAMNENALQGFWNGATPPLGYCLVEAGRRGQKTKHILAVDPVGAELVKLIFALYLDGNPSTNTPPLGYKEIAKFLNGRGYTTTKGGFFGTSAIETILTNTAYIGESRFGVRNSKTGKLNPPDQVIISPCPSIIDRATLDRVTQKREAHHPTVLPPRTIGSALLLSGLAKCGICGGGMTYDSTGGKYRPKYTYYKCSSNKLKGETDCIGMRIKREILDEAVISAVRERVLKPARLSELLQNLIERRQARSVSISGRALELQQDLAEVEAQIKRLYEAISKGVVEIDELLKIQITDLKARQTKCQAAIARMNPDQSAETVLTEENLVRFSNAMTTIFADPKNPSLKSYLRSLVGVVEVNSGIIRVIGRTDAVYAAISRKRVPFVNVREFEPKWRARSDSNARPSDS